MSVSHTLPRTFLIVALLVLVFDQRPSAGQEELTGEYRQSWALLIGIDRTPAMAPLNGVGDAEKMAVALVRIGFPEANVIVLRNPTAEQIRHNLYYAFPRMDMNDRYLVFFSGHGAEFQRPDGSQEGYLLASNTNLRSLHTTAIPMDDLKNIGRRVPAKHVLFILDACFSGLAIAKGEKDHEVRAAPPEVKPLLRRRVVQILAAGTGDQKAYQVANQGIFTKWVVEGLRFLPETNPAKPLTFTGLADWVREEVSKDSNGRLVPQPDRPWGIGEFVLRMPTVVSPQSPPPTAKRVETGLPTTTPRPPTAPRVAPSYTFDGFRLGTAFSTIAARSPYNEWCDDDPIDNEARRIIVYGALPCRGRTFPEKTSVVFYIGYSKGRDGHQQPIQAFAWLGGNYFATRSDFPLRTGEPESRAVAVLGPPRRRFTIAYAERDELAVLSHPGDIYSLVVHGTIVGFVAGRMPEDPKNEQWEVPAGMYARYTVGRSGTSVR